MLRMLKILCILKVLVLIRAINQFVNLKNDHIASHSYYFSFGHPLQSGRRLYRNPQRQILEENKTDPLQSPLPRENDLQSINNATLIPSKPTFPRAFVNFDYHLTISQDFYITFRWNQPEFTNGVIQKYTIQQWCDEKKKTIRKIDNIPATQLQYKMWTFKPNMICYFEVQAHNQYGASPYTDIINASTTHHNPIPLLLVTSESDVKVLDMDLQITYAKFTLKEYLRSIEIVYWELEHQIYWINDKWELMTCSFNPNFIKVIEIKCNEQKITDLDASAHDLRIDWVARNLYWIQFSKHTNNIIKLDLTLLPIGIVKRDSILKINDNGLKFLNILPSIGYFYWMGLNSDNQYVIMQSDFDGKNVQPFLKNKDSTCFCPYKLLELSSIQIDNTNFQNPLLYWTSKDRLIAADIYGCRCNLILSAENNQILFNNLTIDKTNIYLYSSSERLIYILNKKYALLESKENAFKYVQEVNILDIPINIHQIIALSDSLQPYPPIMCLLPYLNDPQSLIKRDKDIDFFEEVATTANSIVVNFSEPVPSSGCEKYNLPTIVYMISVSYKTCMTNNTEEIREIRQLTYGNYRHSEIKNLTPFTTYTLKVELGNSYIKTFQMISQFKMEKILRTTAGNLNAPENVTVQILTPTLAKIYWMPPKKLNCVVVKYEVHWMSVYFSNDTQPINLTQNQFINNPKRTIDDKYFMTTKSKLLPGQEYLVYVRVYPVGFSNLSTDSLSTNFHMYLEPNNLILSGVSTNSINISWNPSFNITYYKLAYKEDGAQNDTWEIAKSAKIYNYTVTYHITNLLPRTWYKFYLILRYSNYKKKFSWPPNKNFTVKTLGDVPSAPGMPEITKLQNSVYQLNWKPAVEVNPNTKIYDPQVTVYQLEGLIVENNYKRINQTDKNEHWNLYYNGTQNHWIIRQDMKLKHRFRVRAENAYGFGEWSESSAVIDLVESIEILDIQYDHLSLMLIMTVLVIAVIYICYFYYSCGQKKERKKQVLSPIMSEIELATLYEISHVQFNPSSAPTLQHNQEEFALTRIREEQITLTKLLGSGAFGKVYQGIVKNFEGSSTMPVAIKMLRKNASSKEKTEFLQEAKLMSHLCHKHVLRLLGICIDANSSLLILELMEGGDLLKYLRENQTLHPSDSQALRLQDLLAMCEDVARGCCYLEKMHFVHRDLACRNCLISARNRENRIVKIGDFGLSRDIYKDDYYRKKGEGLLPIRWMAPESLLHGIFTSQSDVWSFGVLMWEITSLGEQPYPAKSNLEVLEYVRKGGKLSKPLNCPPILYQLMQHCWNTAKGRPNFTICLNNIVTLRNNIEDAILSSMDIIRHAELAPSGQMEEVAGNTINRTSKYLTANDASNDVIEPLT